MNAAMVTTDATSTTLKARMIAWSWRHFAAPFRCPWVSDAAMSWRSCSAPRNLQRLDDVLVRVAEPLPGQFDFPFGGGQPLGVSRAGIACPLRSHLKARGPCR